MRLIAPKDAVVALRSFPRRFRAALRPTDDENFDEFAHRVGSTGSAPIDHLVDAGRSLALLRHALDRVLQESAPVLPPGVLDRAAREWPGAPGALDDELDALDGEANEFAERVDRVPADDWSREATLAGADGRTVTAHQILDEAVQTAVTDLDAATKALQDVRHAR